MYIRKPHRRRYTHLNYNQQWEVAYLLFFKGRTPKDLSYEFKISLSYISRIKGRFIEIVEVWKDNNPPPEQMVLKIGRVRKTIGMKK